MSDTTSSRPGREGPSRSVLDLDEAQRFGSSAAKCPGRGNRRAAARVDPMTPRAGARSERPLNREPSNHELQSG